MPCAELERVVPTLVGSGYDRFPISKQTKGRKGYNCIAFAAGDDTQRWWPHPNRFSYYWPRHLPRESPGMETVENFVKAFESLGYKTCKSGKLRKGFEKIAIYLKGSRPKHAARQLKSGLWTSKCGFLEDIQHEKLEHVECDNYGTASIFMQRKI